MDTNNNMPQLNPIPEPSPEPGPPSTGQLVWVLTRELLETIIPAIVIALLINMFLAQSTYVYGSSMEPNLHTDQRLMIEKVSYHFHQPVRGDIVVIKVPFSEIPLIKRVIGLPGDVVEVQDSQVYINGQLLNEPYLNVDHQRDVSPVVVPQGQIFVMGDNRNASNDSRFFGTVPTEDIIGRAWLSYWPLEDAGLVK